MVRRRRMVSQGARQRRKGTRQVEVGTTLDNHKKTPSYRLDRAECNCVQHLLSKNSLSQNLLGDAANVVALPSLAFFYLIISPGKMLRTPTLDSIYIEAPGLDANATEHNNTLYI